MSGRIYTIPIPRTLVTSVGGDLDIAEILVPTDKVMILRQARVTQSSDAGDAESEQMELTLRRGIGATSGSGGVAATFSVHDPGDAAASLTGELFNATIATAGGGSLIDLLNEDENIHNGWYHAPAPDERYVFGGTNILVIYSPKTFDDDLTIGGFIVVEEIG